MMMRSPPARAFTTSPIPPALRDRSYAESCGCRLDSPRLPVFGLPVSFLQHRAEATATETEARINVPLCSHTRATRRHTASGYNPDAAGAVIQFISAVAEDSVAVGDVALNCYLFVSVTARVGINSRNGYFFGTRCKK